MRHPTIDDLLGFRDHDADPGTAAHVQGCQRCQAAVEDLRDVAARLGRLPALQPPADRWPRIRLWARWRRRRLAAAWWTTAAAGLLLAVLVPLLIEERSGGPERSAAPRVVSGEDADALASELVAASRELELILQQRGETRRVLTARDATVIADIEDRLALVDAALADADRNTRPEVELGLWLDRVELLEALVAANWPLPASSDLQRAVLGD